MKFNYLIGSRRRELRAWAAVTEGKLETYSGRRWVKSLILLVMANQMLLSNVVEDLSKLCRNVTQHDDIVVAGRSGSSLDMNYNYSIEKDF
jgi:hypothetical protein